MQNYKQTMNKRHYHLQFEANPLMDEFKFNEHVDSLLHKICNLIEEDSHIQLKIDPLILDETDDGIIKDPDGWWYWDEIGMERHGPFKTKEECKQSFEAYIKHLNKE